MSYSSCVANKCKHWLVSVCVSVFWQLAVFVFSGTLSTLMNIPVNTLVIPLTYTNVFVGLFFLWLIWHCAYRKHGTRLLSFYLILTPVVQLVSIVDFLRVTHNGWAIAFIALDTGFVLWWYLMSLKLRKINKSIQAQKSLTLPIQMDSEN